MIQTRLGRILIGGFLLGSAFLAPMALQANNIEALNPKFGQSGDLQPSECESGESIFSDDFSDPTSGWLVDNSSSGAQWSYTDDDEYRVFVFRSDWIAWVEAPISSAEIPSNFCLEVDAKLLFQGSLSDDGWIGLIFAGNPVVGSNAKFHSFEIHPRTGRFGVFRYTRSEDGIDIETILGIDESDSINGVNQFNNLTLSSLNGTTKFYINDQLVTSGSLSASGGVGVISFSTEAPNVNGRFDNYKVTGID